MSRRARERQESLWVPTASMPSAPGNPFYVKLNELLAEASFDKKLEDLCEPFYAAGRGRPSIPPGVYFRMLMIGYFEGIESERGICWRCADSLSLKEFLGYRVEESTPEHSSLSRIRNRLSSEVHQAAFDLALGIVAGKGLLDGKALGIDSTTMEASAALRSIVRRDSGESYTEYLTELAKEAGIPEPTREDLAKIDRKRPKKGSNADWKSPVDPDARITKMKDGSTHLAHCVEHAVDMTSGAIVAATIQDACVGDTQTMLTTMQVAMERISAVVLEAGAEGLLRDDVATEWVADKGYHSNAVLEAIADTGGRSYISEPSRGKRRWTNKERAKQVTYANRKRLRRAKGKALMRKRGELIERSFAHALETGAMRRAHLRTHHKITKRYLIHTAAFNLGLVLRSMIGAGTPKGLYERRSGLSGAINGIFRAIRWLLGLRAAQPSAFANEHRAFRSSHRRAGGTRASRREGAFSPGC